LIENNDIVKERRGIDILKDYKDKDNIKILNN
jgi:hypothetical protein